MWGGIISSALSPNNKIAPKPGGQFIKQIFAGKNTKKSAGDHETNRPVPIVPFFFLTQETLKHVSEYVLRRS